MKKLILLVSSIALLGSNATFAKDKDIFKEHGFNKAPLTLSNGRYNEFFKNEEVVQIGTVLLNTKTNKVVDFLEEDTTKTNYLAEFSSRWLSPDPLAEKYYSISPYAYCANNPVLFIDKDGKEITVSRVVVDGRTTININVTGKVVNQSSTNYSPEQLNQYANRLSSAISEVFTGSGETVDYKCTATITVATAENPLNSTDHAYNILNEGSIPGFTGNTDVVGGSRSGEKNVNISQKILDSSPATSGEFAGTGKTENGQATLERTGSHETGHTATLPHPASGTSDKNVMHQTIQNNAGMSTSESQILQIEKAYKDGNLNK